MRVVAGLLAVTLASTALAQDEREVPYWASISSGQVNMRTGPGEKYPAIWFFQRRDLPIKVVQRYDNWRKVEDPDGVQGWMAVAFLADRRTGMVNSSIPAAIRSGPDADDPVRYRAEPGVVGRLEECNGTRCLIRVGEREGWIDQGDLWGVDPDEVFD
ncbi:SH3 domain-containing protein [Sphingomicrobium sediminis]|uniref:SH3 domain-containing protein n=1 Tax=Sphingomicrobium sediminis TaxID=2950949 RepID=A0A9X2EH21_9SPHN|nr:SH3 domain-containing protein [Sphingomicrobium sediminis]MCM8557301.1 SH3 domain-containing protein [Sphingomicrobium sediminis]